jgi:uncharacterized protein
MPHTGQTGIVFPSGEHRLHGTLFLAQHDEPKPTALLLHGLPGIEKNYDIAHALRDNGWNSIIFHYRGNWGSGGNYVLKTIPQDVQSAIDYLSSGQHPQIDPNNVVIIGHSMGGWAAILAAAMDERARGAAVYCAVTDPRRLRFGTDVVAADFTPWLHGMTPEEFEAQWQELGTEFAPVEQVARISPRPVLIIHAEQDNIVPVSQAEALYKRAGEPRRLILHSEANHSFTWHREWLRERILEWLDLFS